MSIRGLDTVNIRKKFIILTCVLVSLAFLGSGCGATQPIVGKWRDESPASLLYEFLDDGTVVLLEGHDEFLVFYYEIIDDNSLQLYDGMGRIKEYEFRISGDMLIFYDPSDAGVIAAEYRKEK